VLKQLETAALRRLSVVINAECDKNDQQHENAEGGKCAIFSTQKKM